MLGQSMRVCPTNSAGNGANPTGITLNSRVSPLHLLLQDILELLFWSELGQPREMSKPCVIKDTAHTLYAYTHISG